MSLDGIQTTQKVPCITVLDGATLEMRDCELKGDKNNEVSTAGVVAIDADIHIEKCKF